MLDLKKIRQNPEKYIEGLKKKGVEGEIEKILNKDVRRRDIIREIDELRYMRNKVSREIAEIKKTGEDATDKIRQMREVGEKIKKLEGELKEISDQMEDTLSNIPNIPHPSVKVGSGPDENIVIRQHGSKPEFDFEIKDHLELGESLGILEFKRASKISGTGFPMFIGKGARLERALINFMLDYHIENHGYKEVFPPYLVTRESTFGTGQLPKLEEDMYRISEDDLFLIPTAEVPVTNIHRDEIIPEKKLPIKYVSYSACFRREAGSYGKETRGLIRVHQFNKVELVHFTTPDASYHHLELILSDAEEILQLLGLHYRVVELCTGDLSFAAAKCYDIEVWAPATGKYLEVSSVSNFEDFQARRANIRYRRSSDNRVDYVHTLNGSGVATPRLMVALLETYQTDEGTVFIPEVLQKYAGFSIIKKGE